MNTVLSKGVHPPYSPSALGGPVNMDAPPPWEDSTPGGYINPAGVPTAAALPPLPHQGRLQTNPGEVTGQEIPRPFCTGWATAPSGARWGAASALLSEEIQHPSMHGIRILPSMAGGAFGVHE